jgi:hypothetical protein
MSASSCWLSGAFEIAQRRNSHMMSDSTKLTTIMVVIGK